MATTKRKRFVIHGRRFEVPDVIAFYDNHVATSKQYFERELVTLEYTLAIGMKKPHERLVELAKHKDSDPAIATNEKVMIESYLGHMVRYEIIELFSLLDQYFFDCLEVYASIVEKKLDYSIIGDDALKAIPLFLSSSKRDNLSPILIRLQFFQQLRHQFAHFTYRRSGMFSFRTRMDSFESHVKKLPGFITNPAMEVYHQGKSGFALRYRIVSNRQLTELRATMLDFFIRVLDAWQEDVKAVHSANPGSSAALSEPMAPSNQNESTEGGDMPKRASMLRDLLDYLEDQQKPPA